jgi:hypothetical protein
MSIYPLYNINPLYEKLIFKIIYNRNIVFTNINIEILEYIIELSLLLFIALDVNKSNVEYINILLVF